MLPPSFPLTASEPGQSVPFIPHILDLTHVQNSGAAFSILESHTWLLTLVSAAVMLFLYVLLYVGKDEKAEETEAAEDKEDEADDDEPAQLPSDGE